MLNEGTQRSVSTNANSTSGVKRFNKTNERQKTNNVNAREIHRIARVAVAGNAKMTKAPINGKKINPLNKEFSITITPLLIKIRLDIIARHHFGLHSKFFQKTEPHGPFHEPTIHQSKLHPKFSKKIARKHFESDESHTHHKFHPQNTCCKSTNRDGGIFPPHGLA